MQKSFAIRLHCRGGQGGVTCAKILAAAYGRTGLSVQTFGDYAGERSGAPVRAFTRVSDEPITNRNKVYQPDHLVVLDPSLLGEETVAGLAPGGVLLLNTSEPPEAFEGRFEQFRLATVDATAIARRHGIGTRSVVIVNTTIAGAFAKVHELPLDLLEDTYSSLGFDGNFAAAREAYEGVVVRPARGGAPPEDGRPAGSPWAEEDDVEGITAHLESPPTGLLTGSWSAQRPSYVERLAPCNAFCPAGNDVVGFIQALEAQGEAAAAEVLHRTTPLPGVCGRVCPAPCMEGCNRVEHDGAVNIRGLERWISDHHPQMQVERAACEDPRRIAIVGSGPAGLSAAFVLARAGHRPTIFEGEAELGGVLRTGIPETRLPREVLDREIASILSLGVEARCGEFLGPDRLAELEAEYDAVILATGLQWLRGLKVEGAELEGVEQGIQFLHRANLEGGVKLSGHAVVLGGGNTAMDCARVALRAGAERVTVAYRRTRLEMPAIREEIDEAEAEGVQLLIQRQPVGFRGQGKVEAIPLAEVEMGEPDESGRRRPVVSDRTAWLDCDCVLLALGQGADLDFLPGGWELSEGAILRDGKPTRVLAAGDLATGDGTVTHALGTGRRAAGLALRVLGLDAEVFERPDRSTSVPVTDIRLAHYPRAEAAREVLEPADTRVRSLDEVSHGLSDAGEAGRCFSCGHCSECDTCLLYCPEGIIHRERPGYEVDFSYCKGCGLCVQECPRSAMEMGEI